MASILYDIILTAAADMQTAAVAAVKAMNTPSAEKARETLSACETAVNAAVRAYVNDGFTRALTAAITFPDMCRAGGYHYPSVSVTATAEKYAVRPSLSMLTVREWLSSKRGGEKGIIDGYKAALTRLGNAAAAAAATYRETGKTETAAVKRASVELFEMVMPGQHIEFTSMVARMAVQQYNQMGTLAANGILEVKPAKLEAIWTRCAIVTVAKIARFGIDAEKVLQDMHVLPVLPDAVEKTAAPAGKGKTAPAAGKGKTAPAADKTAGK